MAVYIQCNYLQIKKKSNNDLLPVTRGASSPNLQDAIRHQGALTILPPFTWTSTKNEKCIGCNLVMRMWTSHHLKLMQSSTALEQEPFDLWMTSPTLTYTVFSLFFSKTSASAEAKPYPLTLVVNKSPAVFIFYHAWTTDFEEKIESLWTGYAFTL